MTPTRKPRAAGAKTHTRPKTSCTKKAAAKRAAPRGRLTSMRSSDAFREFVITQLSGVRALQARAMFGGVGLYAEDVFFGIIAANMLYLKVDDTNRAAFEREGCSPFKPYADRPMVMPYYHVPASVLEDADTLAAWAMQAVGVARASKRAAKR